MSRPTRAGSGGARRAARRDDGRRPPVNRVGAQPSSWLTARNVATRIGRVTVVSVDDTCDVPAAVLSSTVYSSREPFQSFYSSAPLSSPHLLPPPSSLLPLSPAAAQLGGAGTFVNHAVSGL
ncbi:hypothetical protein EYF80_021523 [Liparis tanakae]|uniref:Uncharacterized protein n=1 Tax=Liparis tanakae TaxID=230148 RepID=A0A4Z2HRJ9_9TELE|nr:hypothetical protein EYF80_021523 [Liparis tanakae]